MSHPIPSEHETKLADIFDISPGQPLPEEVVAMYNRMRTIMKKLGRPHLLDTELILIPLLVEPSAPITPKNFFEQLAERDRELNAGAKGEDDRVNPIQHDDLVIAKFRGEWGWANYKRHSEKSKKVQVVLHDETGEIRHLSPASVRFPTSDELEAIGHTIGA